MEKPNKKTTRITNDWFYTDASLLLKLLSIYVKGDMLLIVPILIAIGLTSLISLHFMLVVISIYISIRGLGEMIYWFLQQFHDLQYRPYDFGLKNLDNKAIYILYQLGAMGITTAGLSMLVYLLYFGS